jgi:hypothetical protein
MWSMATTAVSPPEGGDGDALEKEAVVITSCRIATAASASMMAAEADSSSRRRVMARMRVRALAGFFSAA